MDESPPEPPRPDPFEPLSEPAGGTAPKREPELWEPAPIEFEPPLAEYIKHWKHGVASRRWVYRDSAGKPLTLAVRFDLPDGGKEVLPYSYGRRVWTIASGPNAGKRRDVSGWHFKMLRQPRPLYGLDRLAAAPEALVLIVEGEKTADAAQALFPDLVVVTSQGGSKAADKADWEPLAGRHAVLWADNDAAGASYGQTVAAALLQGELAIPRAESVRLVTVPAEWGEGWDLADADAAHASLLREMIDAAEAVDLGDAGPDIRPSEFTDEGLALRFADKHGTSLRYVAGWGRWMEWSGVAWKQDGTLKVFDLSRSICRRASGECTDAKVAAGIASARTVAAVERLAKADRRHAATVDQWDSDPWLLNTPAGVVDLRTGEMRAHSPADYMTKQTAVSPAGECPIWRATLHTVMAGKQELIDFLQRMFGYSLTGLTSAHAMFFCFGTGANGKGVILNTATKVFGSYAATAPMDTFVATTNDRHPTDLAMLRGARLVTAQETEQGRNWAEAKIKSLTGGDPITARFMRQDFFTFDPAFKLVVAGNHKPGLRSVDEAIRRRLNLIPFAVTIPPDKRDEKLTEKLEKEWPGILAWMIEGCRAWKQDGLKPPAAVTAATDEYLSGEDSIGLWIEECCLQAAHLKIGTTALFQSWSKWAAEANEFVGSQKKFTQALQNRGFKPDRLTGGKAAIQGLGLRPPDANRSRYEAEPPPATEEADPDACYH